MESTTLIRLRSRFFFFSFFVSITSGAPSVGLKPRRVAMLPPGAAGALASAAGGDAEDEEDAGAAPPEATAPDPPGGLLADAFGEKAPDPGKVLLAFGG